MSFKNIVTSENLLDGVRAANERGQKRTAWRKRAAKSTDPVERKAAGGNLGQLSNKTKNGG